MLRRRRWSRLVLAGSLAVVAGATTAGFVGRAQVVLDAYGRRVVVAVATRDLPVGTEIGEGDVARRELPVGLVRGTPIAEPAGRVVVSRTLAGEPVVAERVGPDGVDGPMALAPPGARAVAVPSVAGLPPLAVGDRVDVLAITLDGSTRAGRVATDAVVVDVGEDAVTVAVAPGELGATARAALEATAIIALAGAG
jgi:Flp pilus assembly protein CpaB